MLATTNILRLASVLIAFSLALTAAAAPAAALGGPKYTLPVEHPTAVAARGNAPHKTFTLPVEPPATARALRHKKFTLPTQPPATARAVPTRPPICDVACGNGHVDPTTCSCIGSNA